LSGPQNFIQADILDDISFDVKALVQEIHGTQGFKGKGRLAAFRG